MFLNDEQKIGGKAMFMEQGEQVEKSYVLTNWLRAVYL